jgi:hypothetical protein
LLVAVVGVEKSCRRLRLQLLVLLVKSATLETLVDQSCSMFRDQLLVLLVKRETLETGVDQSCKPPRTHAI